MPQRYQRTALVLAQYFQAASKAKCVLISLKHTVLICVSMYMYVYVCVCMVTWDQFSTFNLCAV